MIELITREVFLVCALLALLVLAVCLLWLLCHITLNAILEIKAVIAKFERVGETK
jgi:hypothetical protein